MNETHLLHHRANHPKNAEKKIPDPDAYMTETPWLLSAWNCFWDAEMGK